MQKVHKIYGPPGTGKTTRLIEIVKEEITNGKPIDRIAYLAHTKAAADEAYDRVKPFALGTRPRFFCTIHAAARRITNLNRSQIWGGDEWGELSKMTGMRYNVGAEFDDERSNDVIGDPLIQCINFAKARMITVAEAMRNFERYDVVTTANIIMVEDCIAEIKKRNDKYDFDDILAMYHSRPEPIPADLVLVDEAQDLSVLQWHVVREMWKYAKRVVLCGDDDQSIYSFLGADPDGFLNFPSDTSEVLPVSWRVPRKIGKIAERIIGPVQKRQQKKLKWRDEDGIVERAYGSTSTLPIKAGETTMVLVRHNIQGRAAYKAIREGGIPCAYNGESYLTDKEARALKVFLSLRGGEEVTWAAGIAMMKEIAGKERSVEHMMARRTANDEKRRKLKAEDFDIDFMRDPAHMFGTSVQSSKLFAILCWNVARYGPGILCKIPDVNIMTIHAAKGREADHVIVIPDCYASVWEAQDGNERDTERKVAYVAVTRARHRLTIMNPTKDMYIRALTEAL